MPWQLDNDRPIYVQLVERLKLQIISGQFKPGDKMPSVRELAAEAGVNPNTMQKAFAELERDGLVQTFRTSGREVTQDEEKLHSIKAELAKDIIQKFLEQMKELGFERQEAAALLEEACKEEKE